MMLWSNICRLFCAGALQTHRLSVLLKSHGTRIVGVFLHCYLSFNSCLSAWSLPEIAL